MYLSFDEKDVEYLKRRDKRLAAVIESIGLLPERREEPDIFSSLVHRIAGQQISTKAQQSVWARITRGLSAVTPENVAAAGIDGLRSFGLSQRKAEYILHAAQKVISGEFVPSALRDANDEEAIETLCSLRGVGVWTAEMLLIFSLGRRDVLSFGDLGIQRGLRMLYRHKEITPAIFDRYRKRYSPCGTLA